MDDYDFDAMERDGIHPTDWLLADEDDAHRFDRYRRPRPASVDRPTPNPFEIMRASMTPDEWADFCTECAEADEADRIERDRESAAYTADVLRPWHTEIATDPSLPF